MMVIPEASGTFTIQLPSSFAYFERSFIVFRSSGYEDLEVDGVSPPAIWGDSTTKFGYVSASALLPDTAHVVDTVGQGALIIVYTVP